MKASNMFRIFCATALLCLPALAGEKELAKAAQNPVGDLISIPFQYNANFGVGPEDEVQSILNIQPVYPINLTEEWNWINRIIIPVIDQPSPVDEFGLGDVQYQGFLTPAKPKGLIWGVGPVFSFPTASEDLLGSEQWSAGAGIVLLKITGPWVVGGLANNIWSVDGEDDREDVNTLFAQYFINYNFPRFYLVSAPAITANWKADSGEQWTIPFGGGLGKIIKIGKLPLNCQLAAYYNVEHPTDGAERQTRLQIQLMFPK